MGLIDYKIWFELKQDEWIEACGEIDVLKEQNKILREALEKYAEAKRGFGGSLAQDALEKCSPHKDGQ